LEKIRADGLSAPLHWRDVPPSPITIEPEPRRLPPTHHLCPFNTESYASGLSNIGAPEVHQTGRLCILRRPISETPLFDGMGPWPYLWIDDPDGIDALYEGFRHLLTVTVVTQPGYLPAARGDDAILLKQHFVYDPAFPTPILSKRARSRLSRSEAIGSFEIVTDFSPRMVMREMYESLRIRRALSGPFFDFPAHHFEVLAGLESAVFFRVTSSAGVSAMACGVVFGGALHLLHTAISDDGLRWSASYLLMHGLQSFSRRHGLRLLTGGVPAGAPEGVRTFKARWANRFEPVYLLRIINDRASYAALCSGRSAVTSFFPAYRAAA
jgi:hypothetical protein